MFDQTFIVLTIVTILIIIYVREFRQQVEYSLVDIAKVDGVLILVVDQTSIVREVWASLKNGLDGSIFGTNSDHANSVHVTKEKKIGGNYNEHISPVNS